MIFLSYARADGRTYAEQLESDLNAAGFETWRDKRNLNEYNDFSAELEINIRHATFVAVVVTPSIEENPGSFVRREILYAQSKNKPIIPLIFPDATPPILINHLTFIEFQDYAAGFAELLERLKKSPQPSPQPHTDDPFRPYLRNLYDWIVSYLEKTVFALITLRAEATPDAVRDSALLPMTFLDTFSIMAGIKTEPEKTTYHNIHQAFEKYQGRLLLLGEPGAGKTTTLMAFAREMVTKRLENPALPLPILAPIVTWDAEKQPSLADWLSNGYPDFQTEIARQIQQGKALLLLDGLDELGREREDRHTKERYDPRQRFVKIIPDNNQILISCRIKDYEEIGKKLALNGAVTLQPLDDLQMKDYLRELPGLWLALEKDAELRQVARTPLLLSLFTIAFQDAEVDPTILADLSGGDLRDKIFETYVIQRYKHEERKPFSNMQFLPEQIYEVLGNIAMKMIGFVIFVDSFGVNRFIGKSGINEATVDAFIDLCLKLHLIVPAQTTGSFRFIHLLLAEYFAFNYSVRHIAEPEWYFQFGTLDATPAWTIAKMTDNRILPELITLLCDTTQESRLRCGIIDALGELGNLEAAEYLLKIAETEDKDIFIRDRAFSALGQLKYESAIPFLLNFLDKNPPEFLTFPNMGVSAAYALGKIGEPALEILLKLLNSENETVRKNTAIALGVMGDKRGVEPLTNLIKFDKNTAVIISAIKALGRIRDSSAFESIVAHLKTDNPQVLATAVETLGNIKDIRAVPLLLPLLKDTRESTYERVSKNTAEALEKLDTPEASEAVLMWLLSELSNTKPFSDTRYCDIAAEKLEKVGTPVAVKAVEDWLISELSNPELEKQDVLNSKQFLRRYCDIAAEKLEKLGTPEALEAVRRWREQQSNC